MCHLFNQAWEDYEEGAKKYNDFKEGPGRVKIDGLEPDTKYQVSEFFIAKGKQGLRRGNPKTYVTTGRKGENVSTMYYISFDTQCNITASQCQMHVNPLNHSGDIKMCTISKFSSCICKYECISKKQFRQETIPHDVVMLRQ